MHGWRRIITGILASMFLLVAGHATSGIALVAQSPGISGDSLPLYLPLIHYSFSATQVVQVLFDSYPDGTPITEDTILSGDEFQTKGILLAGAPQTDYCSDATAAAILVPPHHVGSINFTFLTSSYPEAPPGCHSVPVEIRFLDPVSEVILVFAGSSRVYTLVAYDEMDILLGTAQQESMVGEGTFNIQYFSDRSNIRRVTFGRESSITAVRELYYRKDVPAAIDLTTPIDLAVDYLHNEYNPDIGLIRESPETASQRYWLATDNWLAAHALRVTGNEDLADAISRTIARYGGVSHGLIEALKGKPINWPPHAHKHSEIVPSIWLETRNQAEMFDWYDYIDLRLYGALQSYQQGDLKTSHSLYRATMAEFGADGKGFVDKAFDGHYATYKLALALYTSIILNEPVDALLVQALLDKQFKEGDFTGGFATLYTAEGPEGDSNTETTSYALLALTTLNQCLRSEACAIR